MASDCVCMFFDRFLSQLAGANIQLSTGMFIFSATAKHFYRLFGYFSKRELPVHYMLWSVTLVHPTQAVLIFRNFSTAFGTLAMC